MSRTFGAVIIGDEILSGKRQDKHFAKIAEMLGKRGLLLSWVEYLGDDRARLAVSYWSASSDEVTDRVITPRAVFADRGRWYVVADDDRSGEQRTFRLDRFVTWDRTGEQAPATDDAAPVVPSGDGWFDDVSDQSIVTLRVLPAGWRVLERLPVRSVDDDGEHLTVAMAVTSERWLRQLMIRLGPMADVVSPDAWREVAADAATELLATRYAAD